MSGPLSDGFTTARLVDASDLAPGSVLKARFRIDCKLGAGGMGEVYRAHDQETGRDVALKRILVDTRSDEELLARRFREEAAILQRVSFPGVPAFVDAFDDGPQAYLAMELIEGSSLDALIETSLETGKAQMAPAFVAQVGIQVCRILVHLHSQSPPLIHRDIKPANCIVQGKDDQVFLVDFGLAREIAGDSTTKTMVGTAAYAPTEQFQGRPEPRSDLYSLGVTMHQLLTGKAPVPLQVPLIQTVLPGLNHDLARIVNRATRPLPEERYRAAADMLNSLEEVLPRLLEAPEVQLQTVDPSDKVQELMRRWGGGKRTPPGAPEPLPEPPKVSIRKRASLVLMPDRDLQKAVDRARKRAGGLYHGRRPGALPLVIIALALAGLAFLYTDVIARGPSQRYGPALFGVNEALNWSLEGVSGVTALGDGDGIELRPPLLAGRGAVGALFRLSQPRQIDAWSADVHLTKGAPHILIFSEPYGIELDVSEKNVAWQCVRVQGSGALESLHTSPLAGASRQEIPLVGNLHVNFTVVGKRVKAHVNKSVASLKVPVSHAPSTHVGAVLLPPLSGSRVVVNHLSVQ